MELSLSKTFLPFTLLQTKNVTPQQINSNCGVTLLTKGNY